MGRSRKQGGELGGEDTPSPGLLAEAEDALRKLGEPTFDLLEDMPVPEEIEEQANRALSSLNVDDYIEHGYAGTAKLAPQFARRLADTPDLRVAIKRAVRLRAYIEKLSKYVDAVAKSVASTALLHGKRASRHHVAELLDGPLSEESLRDLCKELPIPPEPMTDVAFAIYVTRRAEAAFTEVLSQVKGRAPEEALAFLRSYDPQVAEWIEELPDDDRALFLQRLTEERKTRELQEGKPISLHRNLGIRLGAAIFGMAPSTFEARVLNRLWPKGRKPSART